MKINDLSLKIATYGSAISGVADRIIHSGWWIHGNEVANFEKAFADYIGVQSCLGVANGTDALELSMRAVGVGLSTPVATVANAGMYSSTAILAIGGVPVFMDIESSSGNVSLSAVKQALQDGAKAVVVTHLYGRAVTEIQEIADYCFMRGVPLIEDCAQAHGASVDGRRVGSFGTIAAFSFYPTKNLGALGDGGAILTNDQTLAEKVARLRQYGWAGKYQVETPGGRNSRLDELQAGFLSVFLPHLDEENAMRRSIAQKYNEGIHNVYVSLPILGGEDNVFHLYVIRSPKRDALKAFLHEKGIMAEVHYPIPDHQQRILQVPYSQVRLVQTELHCSEVLTLPCYPGMTDEQINRVVEVVNAFQS